MSASLLPPSCKEILSESLPVSGTISSLKCDMLLVSLYIWKNCSAYLKMWLIGQDIPFAFFLEVAFIDKSYSNALRHLLTNDIRSRLAVYADVSENPLPLKSQSTHNFSGIDVSQSVDWECPCLPPHILCAASHSPPPPPSFSSPCPTCTHSLGNINWWNLQGQSEDFKRVGKFLNLVILKSLYHALWFRILHWTYCFRTCKSYKKKIWAIDLVLAVEKKLGWYGLPLKDNRRDRPGQGEDGDHVPPPPPKYF